MSYNKLRNEVKYGAIGLAAILLTAFVLTQPLQISRADVTEESHNPPLKDCNRPDLNRDVEIPSDPIEMNTVTVPIQENGKTHKIAKTVFAEKEIYICNLANGGSTGNDEVKVESTIYVEIFENMTLNNGTPQPPMRKQVELISCLIDHDPRTTIPDGTVRLCTNETVGPSLVPIQTTNCSVLPHTPEHPMEMNTVNGNGNGIVKTIEAEKEIWKCLQGAEGTPDREFTNDKKVDVMVFTEIWENLNRLKSGQDPVIQKSFFSLRCTTLIERAQVEACEFDPSIGDAHAGAKVIFPV